MSYETLLRVYGAKRISLSSYRLFPQFTEMELSEWVLANIYQFRGIFNFNTSGTLIFLNKLSNINYLQQ